MIASVNMTLYFPVFSPNARKYDLVTFTGAILNGKHDFFCTVLVHDLLNINIFLVGHVWSIVSALPGISQFSLLPFLGQAQPQRSSNLLTPENQNFFNYFLPFEILTHFSSKKEIYLTYRSNTII